eukprot:g16170.t1
MGIPGLFAFLEKRRQDDPGFATSKMLPGGACIEQNLRGKIVGIDVSMWKARDHASTKMWAHSGDVTEAQKREEPIWKMFLRVKNYLTNAGAKGVVGVFDSKKAPEGKLVRGNVSKHGKHLKRNLLGLDKSMQQIFTHMGLQYLETPAEIGEADALLAHLQQQGVIDVIDSDDADVFAYGGHTMLKDASPGAKLGADGNELIQLSKGNRGARWELACCAVLAGCDVSHGVHGVGFGTASADLRRFLGEDGSPPAASFERCRAFLRQYGRIPENKRGAIVDALAEFDIENQPRLQTYMENQRRKKGDLRASFGAWNNMDVGRLRTLLPHRKNSQFDKMMREIALERFCRALKLPPELPQPFYKVKSCRDMTKNAEVYKTAVTLEGVAEKVEVRKTVWDECEHTRKTDLLAGKVQGSDYYDKRPGGEVAYQGASVKFTGASTARRVLDEEKRAHEYGCQISSGGAVNASTDFLVHGETLDDGPHRGKKYTYGKKYEQAQKLLRERKHYLLRRRDRGAATSTSSSASSSSSSSAACSSSSSSAALASEFERVGIPVVISSADFEKLMARQKASAQKNLLGGQFYKRNPSQQEAWEKHRADVERADVEIGVTGGATKRSSAGSTQAARRRSVASPSAKRAKIAPPAASGEDEHRAASPTAIDKAKQLQEMGFDADLCRDVLQQVGGNIEQALSFLLSMAPE